MVVFFMSLLDFFFFNSSYIYSSIFSFSYCIGDSFHLIDVICLVVFFYFFTFLCPQVGSNAGIVGMTKEHLGLALALNVPVFVVVTKIDMCPANILQGEKVELFC